MTSEEQVNELARALWGNPVAVTYWSTPDGLVRARVHEIDEASARAEEALGVDDSHAARELAVLLTRRVEREVERDVARAEEHEGYVREHSTKAGAARERAALLRGALAEVTS